MGSSHFPFFENVIKMAVRIYFDNDNDAEAFLKLCRTVAKIMEEIERMKAVKWRQ